VRVALHDDGLIQVGDPLEVFVWADPNCDGAPDDAVLLRSGSGPVIHLIDAFAGLPATFNDVAIAPVAVTGSFFVGALTTTGEYPIASDLGSNLPGELLGTWATFGTGPEAIHTAPPFFAIVLVRAGEMDCDANLSPDACDIAGGRLEDGNGNGIPDPCDCPADLDGSGAVEAADLAALVLAWGYGGPADLDHDGEVDVEDLVALILAWGGCP
jgi:hypothetical protein